MLSEVGSIFIFLWRVSFIRYYFIKPKIHLSLYGQQYYCNHPVYNSCTLYLMFGKGLAVIQQRYSATDKYTWWGEIDADLTDALYLHPDFKEYFNRHANKEQNGLYPTVTLRQIMWALRMKPLPKKPWETVFDRKNI